MDQRQAMSPCTVQITEPMSVAILSHTTEPRCVLVCVICNWNRLEQQVNNMKKKSWPGVFVIHLFVHQFNVHT